MVAFDLQAADRVRQIGDQRGIGIGLRTVLTGQVEEAALQQRLAYRKLLRRVGQKKHGGKNLRGVPRQQTAHGSILGLIGKDTQAQAHLPLPALKQGAARLQKRLNGFMHLLEPLQVGFAGNYRRSQQRGGGGGRQVQLRQHAVGNDPVAVKQLVQHILLQIDVFLRAYPSGMDGHPQGGALEKAVDLSVQLVFRNGLEQVVHRTGLHGFPDKGIIVKAADEDHVALELLLVQTMQQLQPIHDGHFDVRQHQLHVFGSYEGKGLLAVGGKENMELVWVFAPQHGGNGFPDDGFVVNDQ